MKQKTGSREADEGKAEVAKYADPFFSIDREPNFNLYTSRTGQSRRK
jgi:hypothetical protein